jgi:hypothetical protein
MLSAIGRTYSAPVLESKGDESIFTAPQRGKRPDKEVTSFACEVLRVYHGLREFSDVYSDDLLPQELIDNCHENTPRYERMQQGVNSLTGRVTKLAKVDPRIQTLFDLMVKTVVKGDEGNKGLRKIETMVHELIGNENIIPDHPFLKHGLVCVKDDFPLINIKSENLITKGNLDALIYLRKQLLDLKKGLVRIKGDTSFITDTFNDFEKLLTFPEGGELAYRLMKCNTKLRINHSEIDYYHNPTNSIGLNKRLTNNYGHSTSGLARIRIPKYITLAHELIHSLHSNTGENKSPISCKNPELWTNQEEKNTIGHHKKIAGLTENAFIKRTFHLQRLYHLSPPALEPSQYTLDLLIEECKLLKHDDTLIEFIKTNELTIEQTQKVFDFTYGNISLFSKIAHAILDTSIGKQFCKQSDHFFDIFHTAAANNDLSIVERLCLEFPKQCQDCDSQFKTFLVLDSLDENLDLTKLLVKYNFHLEVKTELSKILGRKILLGKTEQYLKAVVRNKELLNISEKDLALLRKTPGLPAEIQQLLTS